MKKSRLLIELNGYHARIFKSVASKLSKNDSTYRILIFLFYYKWDESMTYTYEIRTNYENKHFTLETVPANKIL